jgi:hypothetical protein
MQKIHNSVSKVIPDNSSSHQTECRARCPNDGVREADWGERPMPRCVPKSLINDSRECAGAGCYAPVENDAVERKQKRRRRPNDPTSPTTYEPGTNPSEPTEAPDHHATTPPTRCEDDETINQGQTKTETNVFDSLTRCRTANRTRSPKVFGNLEPRTSDVL